MAWLRSRWVPLCLAGAAAADAVYHSERLELAGLAGAPGGGMVVNVHTNGPQVYAHEIYTLRDAVPGTYQVILELLPDGASTGRRRLSRSLW